MTLKLAGVYNDAVVFRQRDVVGSISEFSVAVRQADGQQAAVELDRDRIRDLHAWVDHILGDRKNYWEERALELAERLIDIAEIAMPDSYLETDSRVKLARETIEEIAADDTY